MALTWQIFPVLLISNPVVSVWSQELVLKKLTMWSTVGTLETGDWSSSRVMARAQTYLLLKHSPPFTLLHPGSLSFIDITQQKNFGSFCISEQFSEDLLTENKLFSPGSPCQLILQLHSNVVSALLLVELIGIRKQKHWLPKLLLWS